MKIPVFFLGMCLMLAASCNATKQAGTANQPKIDEAAAIGIAKADATKGDKSPNELSVKTFELADAWRVELRLKNPGATMGGGFDYLIDKKTGTILSKKTYQ